MTTETNLAAVGARIKFVDLGEPAGVEAANEPTPMRRLPPPQASFRVLWDELDPGLAGPWPGGGTVLFLWPHLRGDLRRPAWARREDDDQDEYDPWWNREDSKVSAALLRPFCAGLVTFLEQRAGAARLEATGRFQAVRAYLRRLRRDRRSGDLAGAWPTRPSPAEELLDLVEGAERSDRRDCTVSFGDPRAALLHARRDERGLWLWLAERLRPGFDRFGAQAGDGGQYLRCAMDWARRGDGVPAPWPPEALHLTW